jgi:hypothetical protein
MKKLVFIFTIAVSIIGNAQCYTSLTQSQNKLLDEYGISYTGLQTRYIMSTNQIDSISDLPTKNGMIKSYSQFNAWNNGQLQIIPDTSYIIATGADYISDKVLSEDSESLSWSLNETHNLLQKIHIDINHNNIKSIEIVEFHMTAYTGCTYIYHMIFIEDYNNVWSSFSSNDNDISLDCPFCTVP